MRKVNDDGSLVTRGLQSGDQIIFDPKNRLLAIWDEHGHQMTFNTDGAARDDKKLIHFIANKSEFWNFCNLFAEINELKFDFTDEDVILTPGRICWSCTLR